MAKKDEKKDEKKTNLKYMYINLKTQVLQKISFIEKLCLIKFLTNKFFKERNETITKLT